MKRFARWSILTAFAVFALYAVLKLNVLFIKWAVAQ